MSSTMTAIRSLGFQNARVISQFAASGMGRVGARNGVNAWKWRAVRGFTQTTARSGGVGNATTSSTVRAKAGQQMGKTFFYARSIEGPKTILQQLRARLFHSSRARRNAPPIPNPTPHLTPKSENLTLGQRMRKLSREYGWAALGVYFALSALDFPFCYLFVRTLGTDRIGRWEHIVIDKIKIIIPESVKQTWHDWRKSMKDATHEIKGGNEINDGVDMADWGVKEAQEANKREASLGTQLALAYAIHKSFIFIRVPLAAAVTPKVVKVLRGWGWDIGKRTTKATKAANAAEVAAQRAEKAARKAQK